jgi:hypothetical protein
MLLIPAKTRAFAHDDVRVVHLACLQDSLPIFSDITE